MTLADHPGTYSGAEFADKITLIEAPGLNAIGKKGRKGIPLSTNWFKKAKPAQLKELTNDVVNFARHYTGRFIREVIGDDCTHPAYYFLWSVKNSYRQIIEKGLPYKRVPRGATLPLDDDAEGTEQDRECFLAHNQRATNRFNRTFTKRNTMTFTYSATLYGFAEQIKDEWSKIYGPDEPLSSKEAFYLAKVNMKSIKKTTVKAAEAMDYLKAVAKIAASAGIALSWVTPSGFKVDHRYNKPQFKNVSTLFGSTRISTTMDTGKGRELNSRKIVAGIAPNFIHSLDAAHLALTVTTCLKEGITDFMMIHDSFGCHAADMQKMNKILRQEFVRMYDKGVLGDFQEQVKRQIPDDVRGKLPKLPGQGILNQSRITDSQYLFS